MAVEPNIVIVTYNLEQKVNITKKIRRHKKISTIVSKRELMF